MDSFAQGDGLIHVGMDTSKNTIAVAVLWPGGEKPETEVLVNDMTTMRNFFARFAQPGRLRVCYEAGPTGFGLCRMLRSVGISCVVVAPALMPRMPGDRVKTDKRDSIRLARNLRAGLLTAIHVPTEQEEAIRDLCRARADLVDDRTRTQNRLGKFLLRHDRIWRDPQWTDRHEAWLAGQRFDDPALRSTFQRYRAMLSARGAELTAIEAELAHWHTHGPFAEAVARLVCYRGVAYIGALTIASEVSDWRRFPSARSFMGFTGLVPSEHSSGSSVRRGHITKVGNAHLRTQLVESAWAYQHQPNVGVVIQRRQKGADPATVARAWAAQQRLCGKYRQLNVRKHNRGVVIAAVARELGGFLWAEMTAA